MLKVIDKFLNVTPMYRLVAYGLSVLCAFSLILSLFGKVSANPLSLFLSFLVLIVSTDLSGRVTAKIFGSAFNWESNLISGLILFLILEPVSSPIDLARLAGVSVVAVFSKYIITYGKRHLFNPAAFALFLAPVLFGAIPYWWIATPWLLLPVVCLAFLIIRKVRRLEMFAFAVLANLLAVALFSLGKLELSLELLWLTLASGPILFFASVMVTEPQTMPPSKKMQFCYAALVGFLASTPWHIGIFGGTPEAALLIGNLLAFIFGFRRKVELTLLSTKELATNVLEFSFKTNHPVKFSAGQYLEWILPHDKSDSRGQRRYFTIASSPTEEELKLGVKFYQNPSTFKEKLRNLKVGDKMLAGQLGGDFILPKKSDCSLVFLAGGIGVTPFRSMIKQLVDRRDSRDVTLFYMARNGAEFAYLDIFRQAVSEVGLRLVCVVAESGEKDEENGFVRRDFDTSLLRDFGVDPKRSEFYISGPSVMVDAYKKILKSYGNKSIKTDYFPGF